jgi:hypothetical protein
MKYIVAQPNNHGKLGHQFQNWSLALALSGEFDNVECIHTPFRDMCSRWENVLNFSKGFKTVKDINPSKVVELPKIDMGTDISATKETFEKNLNTYRKLINDAEDNTLFKLPFDLFPGFMSEKIHGLSDKLRECYWSDKTPHDFGDGTSIGVHIRRGDISKKGNANRWLELSEYREVMDAIRSKKLYDNPQFYVFSEGSVNDFKELDGDDVTFIIGGSDVETFRKMASVDVLIVGLSTYPILASYMSDSDKIFWRLRNYNRWDGLEGFTNVNEILK